MVRDQLVAATKPVSRSDSSVSATHRLVRSSRPGRRAPSVLTSPGCLQRPGLTARQSTSASTSAGTMTRLAVVRIAWYSGKLGWSADERASARRRPPVSAMIGRVNLRDPETIRIHLPALCRWTRTIRSRVDAGPSSTATRRRGALCAPSPRRNAPWPRFRREDSGLPSARGAGRSRRRFRRRGSASPERRAGRPTRCQEGTIDAVSRMHIECIRVDRLGSG